MWDRVVGKEDGMKGQAVEGKRAPAQGARAWRPRRADLSAAGGNTDVNRRTLILYRNNCLLTKSVNSSIFPA